MCVYSTKRFSHDRDLRLMPSKFLRILCPLPICAFCFFFLLSLLQSRLGFSCTCARMPTRSSSTLWSSPLDVSINLQPQLLASLRPTARHKVQYIIHQASWLKGQCFHLIFYLFSGGARFKSWLRQQLS